MPSPLRGRHKADVQRERDGASFGESDKICTLALGVSRVPVQGHADSDFYGSQRAM